MCPKATSTSNLQKHCVARSQDYLGYTLASANHMLLLDKSLPLPSVFCGFLCYDFRDALTYLSGRGVSSISIIMNKTPKGLVYVFHASKWEYTSFLSSLCV